MSKSLDRLVFYLNTLIQSGQIKKADLKRATKLSGSQLDGYLNKKNVPSLDVLDRIADAINIPPEVLIASDSGNAVIRAIQRALEDIDQTTGLIAMRRMQIADALSTKGDLYAKDIKREVSQTLNVLEREEALLASKQHILAGLIERYPQFAHLVPASSLSSRPAPAPELRDPLAELSLGLTAQQRETAAHVVRAALGIAEKGQKKKS